MNTFFKILFINILLFGCARAQWNGGITIHSSESTHFIVTNPQGLETGYDPRGKTNYSRSDVKEDIPGSSYRYGGMSSLNGDYDIQYMECYITLSSTDEAGKYHLLVIGTSLDTFFVNISCSKKINGVNKEHKLFLIEGVLECDSTLSYDLTFPINDKPYSIYKNVSINSLRQDVNAMQKLGWIQSQITAQSYNQLYSTVSSQISTNDFSDARVTLNAILNQLHTDSSSAISGDACKLLSADTRQLLKQLPNISQCTVKLLSSTGSLLTSGSLQYKDSTWENAANNNDGTFTINTTKKKLSLRMTYAFGTQTKSNVTIKNDSVIIFQTKNVAVDLQNSQGAPLDTGVVQYNSSSGWQDFGTTSNGVVTNELLPVKYTFRLMYNGAIVNKAQSLDSNATVVFQTVPANVQLQTSTGVPLDTGIVQFNAGGPVGSGWKPFGTTTNGVVTKELLPIKYTFRMTYNGAAITKAQSLDSNATVVFQTVPANVQLQTSTGIPLDTGIVQFNAGGPVGAGWKPFGTTANGVVTKELLPTKYNFRITYDGSTVSQAQSIDSSATVVFQTVKTIVQFNNSLGNPIDTGVVQFNSGGWQNYGSTSNGIVSKELLPVKYTFRLAYCGSTVSIAQNVDSNATVVFSTVLCTVSVTNSSGSLLNNATVSYNAGGWNVIGTTVNGIVTKELLPVKIQFRAAYGSKQQSVTQDVSTNPFIAITLPVQ